MNPKDLLAQKAKLKKKQNAIKTPSTDQIESSYPSKAESSPLTEMKMQSRNLEIKSKSQYEKEIGNAYKLCETNTRPLEKINEALAEDLLFINATEQNLKNKNKLTDDKKSQFDTFRKNIQERKQLVADKIKQFREENREIIELQQTKESAAKKLDDLVIEDLNTILGMLKSGMPLNKMVIEDKPQERETEGGATSALFSALRGFDKNKLRKTSDKKEQTPAVQKSDTPIAKESNSSAKLNVKIRNPFDDLLKLDPANASDSLSKNTSKELRKNKELIGELIPILYREIRNLNEKGGSITAIEQKEKQVQNLKDMSKVIDKILSNRRAEDQAKMDVVSQITSNFARLSLDDMTALNKLLKNVGLKRLSEYVDLSGSQTPTETSRKASTREIVDVIQDLSTNRELRDRVLSEQSIQTMAQSPEVQNIARTTLDTVSELSRPETGINYVDLAKEVASGLERLGTAVFTGLFGGIYQKHKQNLEKDLERLKTAADKGQVTIVKELIDQGIRPNLKILFEDKHSESVTRVLRSCYSQEEMKILTKSYQNKMLSTTASHKKAAIQPTIIKQHGTRNMTQRTNRDMGSQIRE